MSDIAEIVFDDPSLKTFDGIGAYTIPAEKGYPIFADRRMLDCCQKQGMSPLGLTDDERKQFMDGCRAKRNGFQEFLRLVLQPTKTSDVVPGCFTIGVDEAQSLIMRHVGHGTPDQLDSYEWNRKEICAADRIIGFAVTSDGRRIPTREFKIHYSDYGVHAVPKYDKEGEPDEAG